MSRQRQRPRDVDYVCLLKRFTIPGSGIPQPNGVSVLPLSWLTDGAATRRLVDDCRWMNNSNPPNVQVSWTCMLKAYGVPEGSTGTQRGPLRCTLTGALPQMWTNRLRRLWLVALVAKYVSSYTFNFLLLVRNRVQLEERPIQHIQKYGHLHIRYTRPFLETFEEYKKAFHSALMSVFDSRPCVSMLLICTLCTAQTTSVETSATNSSSSQLSAKDARMSRIQNLEEMVIVSLKRKTWTRVSLALQNIWIIRWALMDSALPAGSIQRDALKQKRQREQGWCNQIKHNCKHLPSEG